MDERNACETTRPEGCTTANGLYQTLLAVRWVFPMPAALVTRAADERLVIGRGLDCQVVLPGAETSRHHAELRQEGPLWVVRDLASRNGVFVNGRRVEQESLSPGDVVRVGEWVGVVRRAAATTDDEVRFGELAPGVFGGSVLAGVLRQAQAVAMGDLRIIVQGETGTGKECLARAIHQWSGRRGPFVGVNCAALPESLAEAELFGCRKGAFTGADRASMGHLRSAHEGTLLLDEITDLPLSVQAKLLRALEQRAVVPLGESTPIPIDVRIVAATQEPLRTAVERKRFRADLWQRLDGLTVVLPPLRERSEDVPGLFAQMLDCGHAGGSPAVDARLIERLCLYGWPGNVREVYQLARRLSALHRGEAVLRRSHLPEQMLREESPQSAAPPAHESSAPYSDRVRKAGVAAAGEVDESELRRQEDMAALKQAMRLHRNNIAQVARELGISRQMVYRRLEGLPDGELDQFRSPRGRHGPSR